MVFTGHSVRSRGTQSASWRRTAVSRRMALWTLAVLALALTACGDLAGLPFAEDPTSTPTPALAPETPSPSDEIAAPEAQQGNRQLVVWLPEFAGYSEEGNAGEVLRSAFRQFEQRHAGVRVEVQEKAAYGPSDILTYLRSGQRVAPAILPDLVLLNSQQIWQLADLGLLSPMERPPMERSLDFYQFALDSAEYGGAWYGVPYAADLMHLSGFLTSEQTAPGTWNELLAAGDPHLYAAAGDDTYENGSVLLQYVGAGGQLLENGSTSSEEALGAVFEFEVAGSEAGVIPPR